MALAETGCVTPMLSFTLDTNCVIAVDEGRPEAAAVRRLADAHAAGIADVAVVAIMASEKQKPGVAVENFYQFRDRLDRLGLGHLKLCLPMMYTDISFLDASLLTDASMDRLEWQVQKILFPNIESDFGEFCSTRKLNPGPDGIWPKDVEQWKNAKCDVQALWSHMHKQRDVFVTSDANFHKNTKHPALIALGAKRIERPEAAAALLPK